MISLARVTIISAAANAALILIGIAGTLIAGACVLFYGWRNGWINDHR